MPVMDYIIQQLEALVHIASPSGYTKAVMKYLEEEAVRLGFLVEYNKKGGLMVEVPGESHEVLALGAHVDTLGAMVRSIGSSGMLAIAPIGGFMMESVEGMYCKVHTRSGKVYTGTILTKEPSVHTYDHPERLKRKAKNMEIRLDERVCSKEEVEKLSIGVGDYVSFDPMFVCTNSGFIKSRHLDDKASVALLFGLLKEISESGNLPKRSLRVLISNYEEVGYGASWVPEEVVEFLALDMGALGDDLSGDEYKVSICAKDSGGPYDYDMVTRLVEIAKERKIAYAVDVFPHYGSDGTAALSGGNDIRTALIGPGIHASHGTERTHVEAMVQTFELLKGYVWY